MGYSEYTRNKCRLAAGNFLGSKFDKYERTPTDYDYALFAFLFSGTVAEHYDKNKHDILLIKRCKHLNHHIHNTIAITPENLIFAIKLIKLFREKSLDTYLNAEIVKFKIKDFHGEVFDNEIKVSGYIHQHVKTLKHLLVCAVFMALSQVYDVTTSKKLTLEYMGFENIIKVNEHINLMEKDFIFDVSIQQTYIKREVDTKIENIDGFRKIVYRNFAECSMKCMDLLWNEWQLKQNEKMVERDDQVAIAFFKKSIDESISKYDMNKEDVDQFNFISNFYQKYGNEERESKSVNEVINTLKSLTVDDTNVVDNDYMKVDTQVYSLFGSKAKSKSKGRVKYDNEDVDETIEKFDRALNLDNNMSQLRKIKRVNPWINKNYVWSEFAFYIDHVLCFTLIFYHQIYNNIEEPEAEYLKEYSLSNTDAKRFNSELLELCSKVDSLCKSDKDENHYKVFICSFNEHLIKECFDQNYNFNTMFECMSDEHPYFNFNVEMTHICTKIRKIPGPFSPKRHKKLHLMKGYIDWRMEESENSIIEFTDGFMDGDFIDSELSGNYSCCGSKKFKASIDEYPRFMWIKLNMKNLSKRIRRVYRFSQFVSPSTNNIERLELLAVMFTSSRSYFSITKMRSIKSEDAQSIKWCVYNFLVSEELYEVPENNIEDSVLVVKDNDFEKDTYPCLLLYVKCT